ncbi:hypothetical protein BU14_0981s0003 [Porphyra umbilicalis]|uniref:Uncharacterized protein n=1 Tax=Porphyra umbilicalis TaxID=2786 RepID=A0A1X6NNM7_PORUM|nr:hypothetical protein BU14_0981s0003 [Porphyra umbilicalis]|eukprot:OSX69963.1 hypothetical protein BU14_0981s0003 [Porphyra umbilicalis]
MAAPPQRRTMPPRRRWWGIPAAVPRVCPLSPPDPASRLTVRLEAAAGGGSPAGWLLPPGHTGGRWAVKGHVEGGAGAGGIRIQREAEGKAAKRAAAAAARAANGGVPARTGDRRPSPSRHADDPWWAAAVRVVRGPPPRAGSSTLKLDVRRTASGRETVEAHGTAGEWTVNAAWGADLPAPRDPGGGGGGPTGTAAADTSEPTDDSSTSSGGSSRGRRKGGRPKVTAEATRVAALPRPDGATLTVSAKAVGRPAGSKPPAITARAVAEHPKTSATASVVATAGGGSKPLAITARAVAEHPRTSAAASVVATAGGGDAAALTAAATSPPVGRAAGVRLRVEATGGAAGKVARGCPGGPPRPRASACTRRGCG